MRDLDTKPAARPPAGRSADWVGKSGILSFPKNCNVVSTDWTSTTSRNASHVLIVSVQDKRIFWLPNGRPRQILESWKWLHIRGARETTVQDGKPYEHCIVVALRLQQLQGHANGVG
jgi:hypothetical protein